ncbi:hypothetical protein PLICRDRAFT_392232 [Plicaturopsis crispa FD-325 SS-3]|nr:hypothetical protein PLICRDRAFT_392232 [Plicaturopsis crispa FD-325 SS-3]
MNPSLPGCISGALDIPNANSASPLPAPVSGPGKNNNCTRDDTRRQKAPSSSPLHTYSPCKSCIQSREQRTAPYRVSGTSEYPSPSIQYTETPHKVMINTASNGVPIGPVSKHNL